jgi:hypothetical protein
MDPQLGADLTKAGLPGEPIDGAEDSYLPATAVTERYQISTMSLLRWLNDVDMDFPKPLYFGRFRYWRVAELVAWERSRPRHAKRDSSEKARAARRQSATGGA